jgi:hypothetical protein
MATLIEVSNTFVVMKMLCLYSAHCFVYGEVALMLERDPPHAYRYHARQQPLLRTAEEYNSGSE